MAQTAGERGGVGMAGPNVLVLRAAGINCDEEVMHCWRLAGAKPQLIHLNCLAQAPSMLDEFQIVTIPGGFSYGDDIAAGTIFAQRLMADLIDPLRNLVERGGGILGICNGLQVLVKAGLLPAGHVGSHQVTVTHNHSARFEARWVRLRVCTDRCPFLSSSREMELPVEHAEGRIVVANDAVVAALDAAGQVAVRYVDEDGSSDSYPANPNGSAGGVAGLCDPTGRVLGLMPHPDRFFDHSHHPSWTSRARTGAPDGIRLFNDAVDYWGD